MRRPFLSGSVAWNGLLCFSALQKCLRFRCTGEKTPKNFFDRSGDPLPFGQANRAACFGIGKDDFSRALQKHKNGQAIQNLALDTWIRVFG